MVAKKPKSKLRQEIESYHEKQELESMKSSLKRAKSITCGQTTGGVIEIMLRGSSDYLYYVCNPVEAVEFMESIASACGIEILKRPKQDFTAWRSWDLDQPNGVHWKGSAPWQMSDKDKKQLSKLNEKYGILPANINSEERPKLEATSRRKKKVEESDENE